MPRIFLAPYKVELVGIEQGKKMKLKRCLQKYIMELYTNPKDQTRFKCESIKTQNDSELGELIYGYIEYGKYGVELPVLDEVGNEIKEIKENESPMDKYFYLFNFNNSDRGYLILQRIGNIGIRTVLNKAINSCNDPVKIKITPMVLGIKELLNNDIVDVTFEIPQIPKLIEEKVGNILNNEEVKTTVISIKAGRNKSLSSENIKQWVWNKLQENAGNYDLGNIAYIVDEKETIKITVKTGRGRRTINISSGKVRSWIEVENANGIYNKAIELLNEIICESGGHV